MHSAGAPGGRRRHPRLSNPPTGPRAALVLPDAQVPYEIFDRTVLIGRRADCDVALKRCWSIPCTRCCFSVTARRSSGT